MGNNLSVFQEVVWCKVSSMIGSTGAAAREEGSLDSDCGRTQAKSEWAQSLIPR